MRHFVTVKLHDHHQCALDPLPGWRDARQHPIHWDRVGKPDDDLIDQPPLADGPRHRDYLEIRRDLGQAILGVKLVYLFLAIAADHHRHQVVARVRYHCGEGLIGAICGELCAQVLVPNVVQFLLISCQRQLLWHDRTSMKHDGCDEENVLTYRHPSRRCLSRCSGLPELSQRLNSLLSVFFFETSDATFRIVNALLSSEEWMRGR